jgi:hypothetical protein
MYYAISTGHINLKQSPVSVEIPVSIEDFGFISAVSYCASDESLLLTGVLRGDELPSLKRNARGKQGLFRWRLNNRKWTRIYDGYSHDPVPIPGSRNIAFHCGNGLAIVDENGSPIARHKLGTFNWGAPSLSASPGGSKIALIKWKGDKQRLFVYTVDKRVGDLYRPSCYRYCWYDESHVLYHIAHSMKLLSLETGESRVFFKGVTRFPPDRFECACGNLCSLVASKAKTEYSFGDLKAKADKVYFVMTVLGSEERLYDVRYHGLFSLDRDETRLKLEHLCDQNESIRNFDVDDDETIVMRLECYENQKVVARRRVVIGQSESLLNQGWDIMPSGIFPEFGFHYVGQFG